MMRMRVPSVLDRFERELAGNTTPTDPRSQRIRASRKGRPCNELGLAAQRLSAACPHLCAPGTPIPDGLTITRFPKEAGGNRGTEIIMPDNGMAEAFVKTIKRDYARVSRRPDAASVLRQLDCWFEHYNNTHPHKALD
jgi:hypothetical protein